MNRIKKESDAHPEVNGLIKDLDGPDYISHEFVDIGIPSLIILRGVFRVDNSILGSYLARILARNNKLVALVRDKSVLDLGCGCGLLGLVCALHGAKSVHFSDISQAAIKNSRLNSMLLDVNNTSFSNGDLFTNVPLGEFDVVIFNSPVITGVPKSESEASFFREDRVMDDFYKLFPRHLKQGGFAVMPGSSKFNDRTAPINMVREYNLDHTMVDNNQDDKYARHTLLISPPSSGTPS